MTGKQLKNSILQWAIQGKLVPQDPTDEPASVLLEKIRQEKERLIKEKKIKRDKNASIIYRGEDNSYYENILATGEVKCIDEELPFEITKGWEWCRICHVAEIARGGSPRPIKEYLTDATDGVNWIKIGDTEKDSKYITSVKEKIKQSGVSKSRMVHKGDFLLTNSMSFGRPYITQVDGCIHDGWLVISLIEQSYRQDFFYYLLSSGYAYSQFANRVAGAVVQNLNSEKVAISLFPLPPYKEQKRIVQKIAELLPLVEKFGNNKTLLDKLNADINTRLKKSILQEAIQGKLVPQIAEEGTAQKLLEQIKVEKQKLVKEGKLKKSALNDSVIFRGDDNKYWEKNGKDMTCIEDEIPFEIPSSWAWCRMQTCTDIIGGYAFKSYDLKALSGTRVIRISDISENGLVNKNIVRYNGKEDLKQYLIKQNDILIAMTGGTVGKSLLLKELVKEPLLLNQRVAIIRNKWINVEFLNIFLHSPYIRLIIDKRKNSTNDNISMSDLNGFLIPIPPLKEQCRIVEKFENVASTSRRLEIQKWILLMRFHLKYLIAGVG